MQPEACLSHILCGPRSLETLNRRRGSRKAHIALFIEKMMKSLAVYYSEGPQLSSMARSDSKGHVILHHMLLLRASLQSFPVDRTSESGNYKSRVCTYEVGSVLL